MAYTPPTIGSSSWGTTLNQALSDIYNTFATVRDTTGKRYHTSTTAVVTNSTTATIIPFDTVETTLSGMSYSAGVWTITNAGTYDIVVNACGTAGSATGYYVDVFIAAVSGGAPAGTRWGKYRQGIGTSSQQLNALVYGKNVVLTAGATIAAWVQLGSATNSGWTPTNATTRESNMVVQRVA
jgi:hypothetical protein